MGMKQESVCGRRGFHLPPNKQVRHRPNSQVHSGVESYTCTTGHKCAPSSAGLVSPVDIASGIDGDSRCCRQSDWLYACAVGHRPFVGGVATAPKHIAITTAASFRANSACARPADATSAVAMAASDGAYLRLRTLPGEQAQCEWGVARGKA